VIGVLLISQLRPTHNQQLHSPFFIGVHLLVHGNLRGMQSQNTMWADINCIDRILSSILSFVYKFELCVQAGFIIYYFAFSPPISNSMVIAPITEHKYCIFSCISWISEIVVVWILGTTDLQQLERLDLAVTINRVLIGFQYFNLWLFQGMLCVVGLYYSEHVDSQNKFLRAIMFYNILKVAQYFIFFVVWLWFYLCRVLPCCHYFTGRLFDWMRSWPIRRYLRGRVRHDGFDDDELCPICIKNLNDGEVVIALHCEHFYHRSCIQTWLEISRTCPLCKASIEPDEETPLLQQQW